MGQIYFEVRTSDANQLATTTAADIARHLQTRQYLGSALVITDSPHTMLSAVRKQWLRLARILQKQRASTLNAEEILRLTHIIMHMQHMQFAARRPDESEAEVYFITPQEFDTLPRNCFSIYLTTPPNGLLDATSFIALPDKSLFVSYIPALDLSAIGCLPKQQLDQLILEEWQHLTTFLQRHQLNPTQLVEGKTLHLAAMDDALDILLSVSGEFLRDAAALQHIVSLAQPIASLPTDMQRQFEAITRLAHRVQALTPGNFSNYLVKTFGDKEASTYFLRDIGAEDLELLLSDDFIFIEETTDFLAPSTPQTSQHF